MFLPNKIRVEILLPLFDNEGNAIDKSKFFETRKELVTEFKACTFLGPTQGMWIDNEEKEYNDIHCGFYVMAPNTEKSTNFFKNYKETLKKRFKQLDVLITYYPVEIL
ncbi:MAG: hypothetical protein WAM14_13530 [Candidatus Nitrosopolaris sp.]